MERLLASLDRRFGRYAPGNLIWFIVGGTGLVYLMSMTRPETLGLLTLDLAAVRAGEVWRLVTFLFLPWGGGGGALGPFFMLMALWFLHQMGTALEAKWGALRFDVYYLLGALGTIAAAVFAGGVSNKWLNTSLLLAFATEFPDYEILFLFVLPVKMRWLGLLAGAGLLWTFITGTPADRAAIAVAMINYLLFFAGPSIDRLRGRVRQRASTAKFQSAARKPRVCALCGKSSADDPGLEFRLCDCAAGCHGKLTEYCLPHARAH